MNDPTKCPKCGSPYVIKEDDKWTYYECECDPTTYRPVITRLPLWMAISLIVAGAIIGLFIRCACAQPLFGAFDDYCVPMTDSTYYDVTVPTPSDTLWRVQLRVRYMFPLDSTVRVITWLQRCPGLEHRSQVDTRGGIADFWSMVGYLWQDSLFGGYIPINRARIK